MHLEVTIATPYKIGKSMGNEHTTVSSFIVAATLAASVCASVPGNPITTAWNGMGHTGMMAAHAADQLPVAAERPVWSASATGRIEPRDGQILLGTPMPGRIADIAVKANDKVAAGDLLVRLEDDDLIARVRASMIEVQVRERERDEEVVKGLQLERRQGEDSVAVAERALYRTRAAFDEAKSHSQRQRTGPAPDVDKAKFELASAKEQLANSQASLTRILAKEGIPLASRLESSLATARAELSVAESAVERARIRAPAYGNVLAVLPKVGELVAASPDAPLIVFGDLSGLRVKAEVEERDALKIRVGQRVVVKGDAYPNGQFEGVVTSISQALAAPRITTRGVRRPSDVEVLEVIAALEGHPPLLTGMRVDVFFKVLDASPEPTPPAQASSASPAQMSKTN